jgi:N-hydroxyarylamine O-acetyltransferase
VQPCPAAVPLDLDAYLRRVGHDGPLAPTLDVLRALHLRHPMAIPFENLDTFLHRRVPLDLPSVQAKLVAGRRGGYCFEQNLLFRAVLRAIGFRVSALAARVVWGQPPDAVTPRTHMLLRVVADDGVRIADVGFGGATLTAPLCLDDAAPQATPHGVFRLRRDGSVLIEEMRLGDVWQQLYRFELTESADVDHEVANHYVSTWPASHFRHRLIVAKPAATGRAVLMNDRLTLYGAEGTAVRRTLASAADAADVLDHLFGIVVPEAPAFAAAFDRAVALTERGPA